MDALANGVLAGPVAFGKLAIDDDRERRPRVVRLGQDTPAQQPDAERREKIAGDRRRSGHIQSRALWRNIACEGHGDIVVIGASRQQRCQSGGNCAGRPPQISEQALIECVHSALR